MSRRKRKTRRRSSRGCDRDGRSVIVVVVDPETGPAALADLPADGQMRPNLNLDRDLAGWWRDALADPDRDSRDNIFPGAERRTACRRGVCAARVQASGCRSTRARTQSEPVEAQAAA